MRQIKAKSKNYLPGARSVQEMELRTFNYGTVTQMTCGYPVLGSGMRGAWVLVNTEVTGNHPAHTCGGPTRIRRRLPFAGVAVLLAGPRFFDDANGKAEQWPGCSWHVRRLTQQLTPGKYYAPIPMFARRCPVRFEAGVYPR